MLCSTLPRSSAGQPKALVSPADPTNCPDVAVSATSRDPSQGPRRHGTYGDRSRCVAASGPMRYGHQALSADPTGAPCDTGS